MKPPHGALSTISVRSTRSIEAARNVAPTRSKGAPPFCYSFCIFSLTTSRARAKWGVCAKREKEREGHGGWIPWGEDKPLMPDRTERGGAWRTEDLEHPPRPAEEERDSKMCLSAALKSGMRVSIGDAEARQVGGKPCDARCRMG